MSKEKAGLTLLGLFLLIAAAINLARALLPLFLIGLLILVLIVGGLIVSGNPVDSVVFYALLFCILGALITYGVGYSFGNSGVGQAALTVSNAVDTVHEAERNATLTIIDAHQQAANQILASENASNAKQLQQTVNDSFDIVRIAT